MCLFVCSSELANAETASTTAAGADGESQLFLKVQYCYIVLISAAGVKSMLVSCQKTKGIMLMFIQQAVKKQYCKSCIRPII